MYADKNNEKANMALHTLSISIPIGRNKGIRSCPKNNTVIRGTDLITSIYSELIFLINGNELWRQKPSINPKGKETKIVQTVKRIDNVRPPHCILITIGKPNPPYSKKIPNGTVLIHKSNRFCLKNFQFGFQIVKMTKINKVIIQIKGLH